MGSSFSFRCCTTSSRRRRCARLVTAPAPPVGCRRLRRDPAMAPSTRTVLAARAARWLSTRTVAPWLPRSRADQRLQSSRQARPAEAEAGSFRPCSFRLSATAGRFTRHSPLSSAPRSPPPSTSCSTLTWPSGSSAAGQTATCHPERASSPRCRASTWAWRPCRAKRSAFKLRRCRPLLFSWWWTSTRLPRPYRCP